MAKSADEAIRDGKRIESFLADPEIIAAFDRMEARCIAELREAKLADDVLRIHAKLAAISDLQRELRAVKDSGTIAETERAQREKREASARTIRSR